MGGSEDEHALTVVTSGSATPCTALSLCPEGSPSQALMSQAALPWLPRRHSMYPAPCRALVRFLLLLHHRLQQLALLEQTPQGSIIMDYFSESGRAFRQLRIAEKRADEVSLPSLPLVVWFHMLGFLVRRADSHLLHAQYLQY